MNTHNNPAGSPQAVSAPQTFRRVLVPLNVPTDDLRSLAFAVDWARRNEASLFVLHVVDYGSFASGMADSPLVRSPQHCEQSAQRYLRRLADREISDSVSVHTLVRRGNPSRQIVRVAREICADSIILRARRKNWVSRWFAGDTACWVEAHAPCSVIVLREANYGACSCFNDGPRSHPATAPSAV